MSRSNGYAITGTELQAMVNEHILLQKGSITSSDKCLTNSEVYTGAYVYLGDAPSGTFLPLENLGGGTFGPSPNWLANYTNINPIGAQSVYFEMNQTTSPYLNVDLFAQKNGVPLQLDPYNNLDGLFFGGPQYSPQMSTQVDVGNSLSIQANYGRNDQESPGNWGWNGSGYGVLEIYENDVLVSIQTTPWRLATTSANLTSLTYTMTVQPNISYYVKAYAVYGLNDIINGCGSQSTQYLEPYPDYTEQSFYVGPGPAMFKLNGLWARKFYSPGTYPTSGTGTVNGSTNDWWMGYIATSTDNIVLHANGETYSSGSYPNLGATASQWSFIPAGEDSIKIKLYAGSTDTVWEISSYFGCYVPGTLMNLHWSPDTAEHACDSNYSYHYFDGYETTIDGFTGYRQYLVTGGWQVGGQISVYPSGTASISGTGIGVNGLQGYTYPNYADSSWQYTGANFHPISPFVAAGYYSDGSNWALVGNTDGTITQVGTCAPQLYSYSLYATEDYSTRCQMSGSTITYYSYDNPIMGGSTIYEDQYGTVAHPYFNEYLFLRDNSLGVVYSVNVGGNVDLLEDCTSFPAYGTFLTSYCSGYTLVYRYANGYGGYFDSIIEFNSTSCGYNGDPNCLIKGTSIEMADGTQKLIEDIKTGDILKGMKISDLPDDGNIVGWSTDNLTLVETEVRVVKNVAVYKGKIYSFNNGLIESSDSHAHFVKRSGSWMFINAKDIVIGDCLVEKNGTSVEIISIDIYETRVNERIVYDMDVETTDTYIANGLITHNIDQKLNPI